MHHEAISLLLMKELDKQLNGQLKIAIEIFTNTYQKNFSTSLSVAS
jgi:hypothetical protein